PLDNGIVRVEITPEYAPVVGKYFLELHYELTDLSVADKDRKCRVDIEAFRIVPRTSAMTGAYTMSETSDILIGLMGDKGDKGDKGDTGDHLTVRKTYQTEALALADKNPIDPITSLPLIVGQFVSIVDDGEKNGIYRIGFIDESGTMSLELQGKLGDMSAHIDAISESLLSNYIGFEIDEDMNLVMSTHDNYQGPEFVLENGELKVII
ncbi:MAG TPA: hypothetical protein VFC79_06325, partial [Tissierellaceae bacterium]|nr:hypothetical protein [Tissierellaceae bacterium]